MTCPHCGWPRREGAGHACGDARVSRDTEAERDHYREALEWIAAHSQEHTCEVNGYSGYGQALARVHDRARRETEAITKLTPTGSGAA